ncbi:MAG: hypothetical protein PUA90_02190 [bacterium]|nr:hypothetical protein [bacterium]
MEGKEKKNVFYVISVALILIVCCLIVFSLFNGKKENSNLEILELDKVNNSTCKTIYVKKLDNNEDYEYSFNNGMNWQKSNYKVICENTTYKIMVMKKNEIIEETDYAVQDLKEDGPKIEIDFDEVEKYTGEENLLNGVTANYSNEDITDKIEAKITEETNDYILIHYSVENNEGIKTTVARKLDKYIGNTISYDKSSYTCKEGEIIQTKITVKSSDELANIKSYNSGNTNVATIDIGWKNGNETIQTNCINCQYVEITCEKAGTTILRAESTTGSTTTSTVVVEKETLESQNKGSISYDKSSYTCKVGETITATITATSNDGLARVKSYSSNNVNVAIINKHPTFTANCLNCEMVQITCKGNGTTTLKAQSSTGATTTSTIVVEKETLESQNKDSISYDKPSYTCKVGETITATITATSNDGFARVKSYSSNNTNVAIINKHPTISANCLNCEVVQITCKGNGTTTLKAQSSTGATTMVNIIVKKENASISFNKPLYTCKDGGTVSVYVSSKSADGYCYSSFDIDNGDVAKIERSYSSGTDGDDCELIIVNCKNVGTTSIKAISTSGEVATATINVEKSTSSISYSESSYTCKVGDTIKTKINAYSDGALAIIKSYSSNNTRIATIENGWKMDNGMILTDKCINCANIEITCKSVGTTTLKAESSTGVTTTSTITVTSN